MPRTSDYVKHRVIALYKQGLNFSKITRELKENEVIKIYRCTFSKLIKKYTWYGTLVDKPTPGPKSIVLDEHFDFNDAKMEENDELTSPGKSSNLVRISATLNLFWQVINANVSETNFLFSFDFNFTSLSNNWI